LGIGYGTIFDYLKREDQAGLNWPISDTLARLLFSNQAATEQRCFAQPDFIQVHNELKMPGVTKLLLWQV
jgi:transposase